MTDYEPKTEYEIALEKEPWLEMLDPIQYFEYMSSKSKEIEISDETLYRTFFTRKKLNEDE